MLGGTGTRPCFLRCLSYSKVLSLVYGLGVGPRCALSERVRPPLVSKSTGDEPLGARSRPARLLRPNDGSRTALVPGACSGWTRRKNAVKISTHLSLAHL